MMRKVCRIANIYSAIDNSNGKMLLGRYSEPILLIVS